MADAANRESTAQVTVDVVSEPDQPAPPRVEAASGQVTISWETPQLNGAQLTGYRIIPNIGDPIEVDVRNSFVWDGLDNGVDYTFTIVALSDLGESEASGPSEVATPNQVPESPSVRSVTFQDGALFVEWDEPTNLGSDILDYEIRISGQPPLTQLSGGATEFLWDGLINGDNYTFEVRARNDAGWGEWGPSSTPEHPAGVPDAPGIGVTARTQESGALQVNWVKPVSDNGDQIIDYLIESSAGGDPVPITGADTLTTRWADLTNGVETSFRVRARNRAGLGPWSPWSNAVSPCVAPTAPVITLSLIHI